MASKKGALGLGGFAIGQAPIVKILTIMQRVLDGRNNVPNRRSSPSQCYASTQTQHKMQRGLL
eukprot:CAMPEP_0115429186 /NCGR_PEP_ID=MMETSP0271-20121206/30378_1 /TAXON_ID=71861 /ORGANISM="Scrippsiella trochoidea, Strain CCMP3099" /LENGTH=62 /DNA_ID=CAMNT_0002854333 /DNA_START=24 /DNA_END=209 /DNA_ORIENTATION=+